MKVLLIGGASAGQIMDVKEGTTTLKMNTIYPQLGPEIPTTTGSFSAFDGVPYATEYYDIYKLGSGFGIGCQTARSPSDALNELIQGYRENLGKRG